MNLHPTPFYLTTLLCLLWLSLLFLPCTPRHAPARQPTAVVSPPFPGATVHCPQSPPTPVCHLTKTLAPLRPAPLPLPPPSLPHQACWAPASSTARPGSTAPCHRPSLARQEETWKKAELCLANSNSTAKPNYSLVQRDNEKKKKKKKKTHYL